MYLPELLKYERLTGYFQKSIIIQPQDNCCRKELNFDLPDFCRKIELKMNGNEVPGTMTAEIRSTPVPENPDSTDPETTTAASSRTTSRTFTSGSLEILPEMAT